MGKQVHVNLSKEAKRKLGLDEIKIPDEPEVPKRIASDGTILFNEEEDYDTTD